jgi:hypothetical protein
MIDAKIATFIRRGNGVGGEANQKGGSGGEMQKAFAGS